MPDAAWSRLRKRAGWTTAAAAAAFGFALSRELPAYPPSPGLPMAAVGILFLSALTLLHRMYGNSWPALAQFGFVISAVGLVLWIAGGTHALGLRLEAGGSVWARFGHELLSQPQPGWGLFSAGLIPIGIAAIRAGLPLAMRLLLPLGCLLLLGPPLKYVLGDRIGGLAILVAFTAGWATVAALLLRNDVHRQRMTDIWQRL